MRIIKKGFPIILFLLAAACNFPGGKTSAITPFSKGETSTPAAPSETAAPVSTSTPEEPSSPAGNAYELLIVTPREFMAPMQRLAEWKTSTGIPAGLLILEEIEGMCEGRDAPEKIKRCLALYQQKSGIRYAILVGDGDKFPIRWTMADIAGPTVGNTAFYPADLYYADLYRSDGSFDDWDSNGNGYFGEIGGEIRPGPLNIDNADLNPDIAVGRVPVSTLEEAEIYAYKVTRYEFRASDWDWSHRLLAISSGGYLPDDCRRQEEMLALLPAEWKILRMYNAGNPCQETVELSAENIIREMNNGTGLISFLGHGNMDLLGGCGDRKGFRPGGEYPSCYRWSFPGAAGRRPLPPIRRAGRTRIPADCIIRAASLGKYSPPRLRHPRRFRSPTTWMGSWNTHLSKRTTEWLSTSERLLARNSRRCSTSTGCSLRGS